MPPVFNLPPLPKGDERNEKEPVEIEVGSDAPEAPQFPDEWDRRIRIPVNEAIMQALQMNDEVSVTITGQVRELSSNASEDREARFMEVMIDRVDAYPADPLAEEEAAMEAAYNGDDIGMGDY